MSSYEVIFGIAQPNRAGAITSDRYDYQKNWAICKLLELHQDVDLEDYVLVLEYIDDILVIDSSINPTKISFYQIKTKSKGNWTKKNLTNRNNSSNSHLGKLYLNKLKLKLPYYTDTLNFVSNARFRLSIGGDPEGGLAEANIRLIDLDKKDKDFINNALVSELNLKSGSISGDIVFFRISELTVTNHEDITIARLVRFIDNLYPGIKFNPNSTYKTLFDDVRKKSNYNAPIYNFEDLVEKKSITKGGFKNLLDRILNTKNREKAKEKAKDRLLDRLRRANISFGCEQKILENLERLEIEEMKYGNIVLFKICEEIELIKGKLSPRELAKSFLECVSIVFKKYKKHEIAKNVYDDCFIKTVVMWVLN